MIAIAQSKKDLTPPVSLRHSTPVTEKNVTGFGSPEFTGGRPPLTRFFYVRCMALLFRAAVRGAVRLAGSCIRSSNLRVPPSPFGSGDGGISNRNTGAIIHV